MNVRITHDCAIRTFATSANPRACEDGGVIGKVAEKLSYIRAERLDEVARPSRGV
jgi:hypothetical protein